MPSGVIAQHSSKEGHQLLVNDTVAGVDAQLRAGVRYFDIQGGTRLVTSDLFLVPGLYGLTVESC